MNYAAVDKDGHPIELSGLWGESQTQDGDSDDLQAGSLEIPAHTRAPKAVDPATLLVVPQPAIPAKVY
jgi:hypothetical protein